MNDLIKDAKTLPFTGLIEELLPLLEVVFENPCRNARAFACKKIKLPRHKCVGAVPCGRGEYDLIFPVSASELGSSPPTRGIKEYLCRSFGFKNV